MEHRWYRIPFTGFCEILAESPEEALAQADGGDLYYAEYDFGDPVEKE